MRAFTRFGELVYWLFAVVVLTGLVHGALVLLMPSVGDRDAFSVLSQLAPVGATETLPRAAPGSRRFPYVDPAVAAAFCRYDLSVGPVRVRAPSGRAGFFSISLHSRRGSVFFALTDRAATRGKLEAVIATPAQLKALLAADDEDNPSQDLRVVSPTSEGFVVVRAFSELPSLYPAASDETQAMTCVTEPLPR